MQALVWRWSSELIDMASHPNPSHGRLERLSRELQAPMHATTPLG